VVTAEKLAEYLQPYSEKYILSSNNLEANSNSFY